MPRAAYCRACGRHVWVTGDGCQYGHPASCLEDVYEAASPDHPAPAPLPVPESPPSVTRVALRQVLWTVYALPVTIFFLGGSISPIATPGITRLTGIADLAISLPLYVVVHLHAWDKRTLSGAFWKTYAFAFVAWQAAFSFVIQPSQGTRLTLWQALVFVAIQAPMIVAAFRYAFRTWPEASAAPSARPSAVARKPVPVRLISLAVIAALLAVCGISMYVSRYRATIKNAVPTPVYEASVPPPAKAPPISTIPTLTAEEGERLRGLFEAGQYGALERSLDGLQSASDKDSQLEGKVWQAFGLLSGDSDGARLNAWVAKSPGHWAPYLARASYASGMGWEARGDKWASETSQQQFASMGDWFAKASADASEALAKNPRLAVAYELQLGIAQAEGRKAEEDAVLAAAQEHVPHSYLVYYQAMTATEPRWGGTYQEMDRLAARALKDTPDQPRFYKLFGLIYFDQANVLSHDKRYGQAIEVFTKALAYGETVTILQERAWAYYQSGDATRAIVDIDRALDAEPSNVPALIIRAYIRLHVRDYIGASQDIKAAEAVSPNDPEIAEWKEYAKKYYQFQVK